MAGQYNDAPKLTINRPLEILLIEDNQDDAALCRRALTKAQWEFHLDVVKTKEEFSDRLGAKGYDIILADYSLGPWTGADARDLLRSHGNETPVILVTGALGEEKAVECIKRGMSDYILKDRLERLPIAILRAIEAKRLQDERKDAERILRENEAKFRTLAEAIPAACFIEQRTVCQYVNRAASEITGYSREELLEMNFFALIHPDYRNTVREQAAGYSNDELSDARCQIQILTKGGDARWLDVTVRTFEHHGSLAALITAFDVTDRKRAEDEIRSLVISDPLTGLANYRRLVDTTLAEVERSKRTERPFSVLLLDLDGLKQINDTYGHLAGNRSIIRLAEAIRLECRVIDTPARFGGDEFAVVLPESQEHGAIALAERIAKRLAEDPEQPEISFSYGATVCPRDGATIEELFTAADRGLYAMKSVPQRAQRSSQAALRERMSHPSVHVPHPSVITT
jgi:diguanylate cyclase (GGDEF)-like protein/PAS domain S-box-containing protein